MDQPPRKEPLSFAAILKLLFTNRKSGILKVQSPEGELLVHFQEGKIVGVDQAKGEEWIIGNYLTAGEVLSERRLVKALRIAAQRGLAPERVLVDKRFISPDVLKRFMELYSREIILPLFSRVGLVCSFLPEQPLASPWLPPISVPFLLKEGERRAKEWPLISKRIPNLELVYDKDRSFISQVVKDGEDSGNPLFTDRLDPELGANERIIYYFVDGRKSVRQLAWTAGLDLFSACRALYTLENKFMVKPTRKAEQIATTERPLLPTVVRMVLYALLVLVVAGVAWFRPGPLRFLTAERQLEVAGILPLLSAGTRKQIEQAVEAHLMLGEGCPADLRTLVDSGHVTADDALSFRLDCRDREGYRLEARNER